jgi:hypothetical protein
MLLVGPVLGFPSDSDRIEAQKQNTKYKAVNAALRHPSSRRTSNPMYARRSLLCGKLKLFWVERLVKEELIQSQNPIL